MYKYTFLSYGKLSDLLSINNKSDLRNEQSQYIEKYIPSAYDSLHRPYFSRFICIHFPRASCDERRIFDFVIYGESPTSTTRHAHFAPKIGPTGVCCLQATYAATTTPTTIDNHRQQKAAAILCLSCIHFFFCYYVFYESISSGLLLLPYCCNITHREGMSVISPNTSIKLLSQSFFLSKSNLINDSIIWK